MVKRWETMSDLERQQLRHETWLALDESYRKRQEIKALEVHTQALNRLARALEQSGTSLPDWADEGVFADLQDAYNLERTQTGKRPSKNSVIRRSGHSKHTVYKYWNILAK